MKLRSPREAPPGGFYYITPDGQKVYGSSVRDVWFKSTAYMRANDMDVPADLIQIIEDEICARLDPKYCWKGLGDNVASVIQAGATLVDKVFKTELAVKAKGCSGCAQRKRKLNRI